MDGKIRILSVEFDKLLLKLSIAVHPDDHGIVVLTNSFEYNIIGLGNYICHVNPGTLFLYKKITETEKAVAELRRIHPYISTSEYTNIYEIGPISVGQAFRPPGGVGFFKSKRKRSHRRSKRLNKLK